MEIVLHTDTINEAVKSLEAVARICPSVVEDVYQWKWAIIAMHNATQCFMALALEQGNGIAALDEQSAKKVLRYHQHGGEYPEVRLDYFLELFKKIKGDSMRSYNHSKPFSSTPVHDENIKFLNYIRNEFIHFSPKYHSIYLSVMPDVFLSCLEIISFLCWEGGTIYQLSDEQNERINSFINSTRDFLTYLAPKYREAEIALAKASSEQTDNPI